MGPEGLPALVEEEMVKFVETGETLPEKRQEAVDVNPGAVPPSDVKSPEVVRHGDLFKLKGFAAGRFSLDE